MPLIRTYAEVPAKGNTSSSYGLESKVVYGEAASITRAVHPAGYHSQAHVHACEQLNYVVSGESWAFMVDDAGRNLAFHLEAGDFYRVPSMAVHWTWNRSADPIVLIEFHMPGVQGDPVNKETALGLFTGVAPSPVPGSGRSHYVAPHRYQIAQIEAMADQNLSSHVGYLKKSTEVPLVTVNRGYSISLQSKVVYGLCGSLMCASRDGGYHSKPHVHDCEQLNVLTRGRLTGYILDEAGEAQSFEIQAGDFWRIPRMAVHWSWNQSSEECELIELHTPGMHWDPGFGGGAVSLLANDETPTTYPRPRNIQVDTTRYPIGQIEGKLGEPR